MKTRILRMDDVRMIAQSVGMDRLMDDVIARLERVLGKYDGNRYESPARAGFAYSQPATGLVEWMPILEHGRRVVVKVVGYHPRNPAERALPTVLSTISSYDVRTGHLRSLMDATLLTALRTGAASAIASRVLARPDSTTLGLIGCGAQAVTQWHALSRLFRFNRVLYFDIDPIAMETFPARTAMLAHDGIELCACEVAQVASGSDILCTATSVAAGDGAVLDDANLKPHLHINAIGSDFPGKIELPVSLLRRSFVCPDFPAQAVREGECQQLTHDQIGPDLVNLLRDRERHTEQRERLTVFDSTGWALEDDAALEVFDGYARALDVGIELEVEAISDDPRDPYAFLQPASTRATTSPSPRPGPPSQPAGSRKAPASILRP